MDNHLDYIVKSVLLSEVKELSNTEDIFYRIEEEIKTEAFKSSKDYKHYTIGSGYKKYISIAACFLIVCISLMFASSYQARVFAANAILSIKTIFTLEKEGDKLQVVEKPTNEAYFTFSSGRPTQKTDKELEEILGFTVRFPESFGDSFRLETKHLRVVLSKKVDYETGLILENDMYNAIEDDNVLNQLKPYNAVREVVGIYYNKPDRFYVYIDSSQAWNLSEMVSDYENIQNVEIQKVKVGDLDGYWVEQPIPVYPRKSGRADISVRPDIKVIYTLNWRKSDITYTLNTDNDVKLTLEEAIKIAEDFMNAN